MTLHVVITGAASGLGKAMSEYYAARGAKLCLLDINLAEGQANAERLTQQHGQEVIFYQCDITQADQVQDVVEALTDVWGKVDVLVNNAGVATAGTLENEDILQWQWVLDINLLGQVRMTQALLPLLKANAQENANSSIINIASQAGITPIPMMGSYNASKAALVSFAETMHLELAHQHIHVSVACPSFFDTNLDKSLRSSQPGMQELVRKLLSRSELSAAEVAERIVTQSESGRFLLLTHKSGRLAYNLKRFLPMGRYLNMVKKKTRHFARSGT